MSIRVENLAFGYPQKVLGKGVNFTLQAGHINYLIGCNGCGKSTLLKTLSGYLAALNGEVLLKDVPIRNYSHRHRARLMGVLWQNINSELDFTVREMLEIIAAPRLEISASRDTIKSNNINNVIADFALESLLGRCFRELSGGEKQRTLLAGLMLLAPEVLLLDEPTSALDPYWRNRIMEILEQYARKHTVLAVTHDLDLVARAEAMVLIPHCVNEFFCGRADEILTETTLSKVYNTAAVVEHSGNGSKRIYFD